MMKSKLLTPLLILMAVVTGFTQKVQYSEINRDEPKQSSFEIIGKYNNQFLVYKQVRDKKYITVYDADMKAKDNVMLDFLPERIIESDFIAYNDFSYFFYQFQKRNIVYCMMVKFDGNGKALTQPIELDTTQVGALSTSSRIYSVLASEDKQKLMVFKINTHSERRYTFKTLLFEKNMTLLHTSQLFLKMNDRNDFLTDFSLDSDGHLVFGRGIRMGTGENISRFFLITKPAMSDSFSFSELALNNISLDEVKLRMDNYNKRYLFSGFYYKGRKNINIDGICNAIYDKNSQNWVVTNIIPLGEELRADVRGDNNIKSAFNDFYIKQIIIRKDGGFLVTAESNYQTSRGNPAFNRWDYMYNPLMLNSFDYYNGYGGVGRNWRGTTFVRYHADNVIVSAFDREGKLLLTNTIRKSQYDDESEATIGFQLMNTGNALAFLYNDYEKRDVILTYQVIDAEGKVSRPPTMKNLDLGYNFLPRLGKQVSARQAIIPCLYRNSLCFAKLEF